ncbi:MAG: ethyl tert-butyl ether degradation protein EthD [Pseudanabaenaceae cyanobacterium]
MGTVLDRYFEVSERLWADESALEELMGLFAEEAEVQPAGAPRVVGRDEIGKLWREFTRRHRRWQRVWRVQPNGLEATWAVSGEQADGELFAVRGTHRARLDAAGKIQYLEVRVAGEG